jgi:hypothetical protein
MIQRGNMPPGFIAPPSCRINPFIPPEDSFDIIFSIC